MNRLRVMEVVPQLALLGSTLGSSPSKLRHVPAFAIPATDPELPGSKTLVHPRAYADHSAFANPRAARSFDGPSLPERSAWALRPSRLAPVWQA